MTLALVLAALLAVVCVVVVALPFLRELEPVSDTLDEVDVGAQRHMELIEARDRSLAALKELEFDHRTGTVSDDDYRALIGPLRREAASSLQELERNGVARGSKGIEEEGRPTGERIS